METISISIVSYRDNDLIDTVKSAYNNSKNKENLFFSIVSQAEDAEHPDLSFIPESQIRYIKMHWKNAKGPCFVRKIAHENLSSKYFLQIDSHSRFVENWDELVINAFENAKKYWGDKIVFSNYPDPFEINWSNGKKDNLINYDRLYKIVPYWDEKSKMIQGKWEFVQDTENGDEMYFFSANSAFCDLSILEEVPYDENIYFTGEEPSIALRLFTRGIKIISPTIKYMYSNYNRENSKRNLHWSDHQDWWQLNRKSYERLEKIMTGDKSLGIYGIGDSDLFNKYQEITGIDLLNKDYRV